MNKRIHGPPVTITLFNSGEGGSGMWLVGYQFTPAIGVICGQSDDPEEIGKFVKRAIEENCK